MDFERHTHHVNDDTKKVALTEYKTIENGLSLQVPVVTVRYQYDNHPGSASLELDESAQLITYEEYHPEVYPAKGGGTTSYRAGRSLTETSLKRYKYVGKERDEETGLYYYGARYYAAWLCRFVSVDALQFKYPELTPFQYASNRPVSGIDLDGLEFYYTSDGTYLGQGKDKKSTEVRLAKLKAETKDKQNVVVAVTFEGKKSNDWIVISKDHSDFLKFAATAYGESSAGFGVDIKEEIFGIANAINNWKKEFKLDTFEEAINGTKAYAGMDGGNAAYKDFIKIEPDKRNKDVGMKMAIAGAINAIAGKVDYSGGGLKWDGNDAGEEGRKWSEGMRFTKPGHDIFKLGDNKISGSIYWKNKKGQNTKLRAEWDYKWESTAAYGKEIKKGKQVKMYGTVFLKLTNEYLYDEKGKESGNKY